MIVSEVTKVLDVEEFVFQILIRTVEETSLDESILLVLVIDHRDRDVEMSTDKVDLLSVNKRGIDGLVDW